MIRFLPIILATMAATHAATIAADSARGEKVFKSFACVQCHSVNGIGGRFAADLGRSIDRNFTPASLASTMWNHAPSMWTAMREREVRAGDLDEQAAADLFAYFYSVRFFEKPGDAGRGKRLFTDRGCSECHGLSDGVKPGVKPVSQWSALTDPVALTEAMWNHAPNMFAEFKMRKIRWPQLSGQDLSDLLVYLRNLPSIRQKPGAFETSAGTNGEAIFKSKGCAACHRSGSSFGPRIKGRTLTEIAAAMWDHAPRMPVQPAHFEPGEMRELLSYLWARQFFEDAGNAGRDMPWRLIHRRAEAHRRPALFHGHGDGVGSLASWSQDAGEDGKPGHSMAAFRRTGYVRSDRIPEFRGPWKIECTTENTGRSSSC